MDMPTKKEEEAADKALAAAAAPGPSWTSNNAACLAIWTFFSKKVLGQHDLPFIKVGVLKMSELPFFNKVATVGNQVLEAEAIADMIFKLSQLKLAAKPEPGHNYASAVDAMVKTLKDKDKTVADLAAVVDEVLAYPIENFA